jgi:hypothetical protein
MEILANHQTPIGCHPWFPGDEIQSGPEKRPIENKSCVEHAQAPAFSDKKNGGSVNRKTIGNRQIINRERTSRPAVMRESGKWPPEAGFRGNARGRTVSPRPRAIFPLSEKHDDGHYRRH